MAGGASSTVKLAESRVPANTPHGYYGWVHESRAERSRIRNRNGGTRHEHRTGDRAANSL